MAGWSVKGDVLIACNCDFGCPCNFNAPPSRGACEGGWIWSIERGHVDDVRIDGLGVALFPSGPAPSTKAAAARSATWTNVPTRPSAPP